MCIVESLVASSQCSRVPFGGVGEDELKVSHWSAIVCRKGITRRGSYPHRAINVYFPGAPQRLWRPRGHPQEAVVVSKPYLTCAPVVTFPCQGFTQHMLRGKQNGVLDKTHSIQILLYLIAYCGYLENHRIHAPPGPVPPAFTPTDADTTSTLTLGIPQF